MQCFNLPFAANDLPFESGGSGETFRHFTPEKTPGPDPRATALHPTSSGPALPDRRLARDGGRPE